MTHAALAEEVTITDEARQHFRAGVNFLQDPDGARYEEAYREFKAAYAASPSWKILGNLGIAAMKLERDKEAIEAFEKYLEEGAEELDTQERTQMKRDLSTLRAGLVEVKLTTIPAAAHIIDERIPVSGSAVVNRYQPDSNGTVELGLRAGHHKITARLEGYEPAVWEFEAASGSTHDKTLELQAATPADSRRGQISMPDATVDTGRSGSSGLRIASYASLGLGVLGLGAGTYFALDSQSKADEADELCGGDRGACQLTAGTPMADEVTTLNDDAGSAQTLAIIGFAAGGVGVAAGVTLFLLSSGDDSSSAEAEPAIMPWIGYRSAGVTGRF